MLCTMENADQFNRSLASVIRAARKALAISQETLASRAGVTRRFIQELENGRSDISLQTLFRLSQALEMNLTSIAAQVEKGFLDENNPPTT